MPVLAIGVLFLAGRSFFDEWFGHSLAAAYIQLFILLAVPLVCVAVLLIKLLGPKRISSAQSAPVEHSAIALAKEIKWIVIVAIPIGTLLLAWLFFTAFR